MKKYMMPVLMTLGENSLDEVAMFLGALPDDEKRRAGVLFREQIQYARRLLRVRPVIEGQADVLAVSPSADQEPTSRQERCHARPHDLPRRDPRWHAQAARVNVRRSAGVIARVIPSWRGGWKGRARTRHHLQLLRFLRFLRFLPLPRDRNRSVGG